MLVPFDEEVQRGRAVTSDAVAVGFDAAHDAHRVEARIELGEPRRPWSLGALALSHGDDALEIEAGLAGRVLRAQAQRHAEGMLAEEGRQGTNANDPGIGALDALIGRVAVVHREGVHVQRHPAKGQDAIVRPLAGQECICHGRHEGERDTGSCVRALAQRQVKRQQADDQRLLEERVTAEALDAIRVVLTLQHKAYLAAYILSVGYPILDGQRSM